MNPWELPTSVVIGGETYAFRPDFRQILRVIACLEDPNWPLEARWYMAQTLFYEREIPRQHRQEAAEYLARFLSCGEEAAPGPKRMDWQQDAGAILADVNRVAGTEVRALPFLHWWSFIAYFRGIGEGQLSTLVSLREKLRRGQKLEEWERRFYREHKRQVDLRPRVSDADRRRMDQWNALLDAAPTP